MGRGGGRAVGQGSRAGRERGTCPPAAARQGGAARRAPPGWCTDQPLCKPRLCCAETKAQHSNTEQSKLKQRTSMGRALTALATAAIALPSRLPSTPHSGSARTLWGGEGTAPIARLVQAGGERCYPFTAALRGATWLGNGLAQQRRNAPPGRQAHPKRTTAQFVISYPNKSLACST